MKRKQIADKAQSVVANFKGDHYWIYTNRATFEVTNAMIAAINEALEAAAVEIEALERGTYTSAQTPAGLVRAMKVK